MIEYNKLVLVVNISTAITTHFKLVDGI